MPDERAREVTPQVRTRGRRAWGVRNPMVVGCACEPCPGGDGRNRAPFARSAKRRMCRAAQTRYGHNTPATLPRQPGFLARSKPRHPGHRASARDAPRGHVVNARRPGLRPGRSGAKSIDDAEHGATINGAMVRVRTARRSTCHVGSDGTGPVRGQMGTRAALCWFGTTRPQTRPRGRHACPARTGSADRGT